MGGVIKSAMGLVKTATGHAQKAEQITQATRTSPADVVRNKIERPKSIFNSIVFFSFQISWSGCKDSQTSADSEEAGKATGAMSFVSITDFIPLLFFIMIP